MKASSKPEGDSCRLPSIADAFQHFIYIWTPTNNIAWLTGRLQVTSDPAWMQAGPSAGFVLICTMRDGQRKMLRRPFLPQRLLSRARRQPLLLRLPDSRARARPTAN